MTQCETKKKSPLFLILQQNNKIEHATTNKIQTLHKTLPSNVLTTPSIPMINNDAAHNSCMSHKSSIYGHQPDSYSWCNVTFYNLWVSLILYAPAFHRIYFSSQSNMPCCFCCFVTKFPGTRSVGEIKLVFPANWTQP